MDAIVIGLKTISAFPLARTAMLVWCGLFVFVCILSFATATVPDRKLYSAGRDGARKAPLRAIRASYESDPEKWLLYEEEIFYVRDPEELTGEEREAYERARVRCVNGGEEAREIGSRIRLRRWEAKNYLKFFYGLHREKGLRPVRRRRRAEEPERLRELEADEELEDEIDEDYDEETAED